MNIKQKIFDTIKDEVNATSIRACAKKFDLSLGKVRAILDGRELSLATAIPIANFIDLQFYFNESNIEDREEIAVPDIPYIGQVAAAFLSIQKCTPSIGKAII